SLQANTNLSLITAAISSTNLMLGYAANQFGTNAITMRATDDGGLFVEATFVVTVNAVNDPPIVTLPSSVVVEEDTGPRSIGGFATFSPGPANESGQNLVGYTVSNDNNSLFSVQPAIDNAGVLGFAPALDATGSATVTVIAQDDGGTADGGVDKSTNTFTVTVTSVNDAPRVSFATNQVVVFEGTGSNSFGGFTTFSPGPTNESGQVLVGYAVSNSNPALFSTPPTLDNTGALMFTLATNANGMATVTVVVQDNGGTANNGTD